MDVARFPELVRSIYRVVRELELMFPGRPFTPDGHMVGSLGEALAQHYYGIELLPPSSEGHDGKAGDKLVQVKATQIDRIGLSSEPQHLLVLKLDQTGGFQEVYNGPGAPVWATLRSRRRQKNGQYQVTLSRLAELMGGVPQAARLPRVRG